LVADDGVPNNPAVFSKSLFDPKCKGIKWCLAGRLREQIDKNGSKKGSSDNSGMVNMTENLF